MDRKSRFLVVPHALWFFFLVLGPFVFVLVTSFSKRTPLGTVEYQFTLEAYKQLLHPLYLELFGRTLLYSSATTLACIVVAYPTSFLLTRLSEGLTRWILCLILVPLWTNFLVRTLSTMDVLRLKPFGMTWVYTGPGVLYGLCYCYLPFAILPIYNSLKKIDPLLVEAAKDLGASPLNIFLKVLWPLSKKGVYSAALIIFIPCFGEFLIPEIVGGGSVVLLGTFLQNQFMAARNWPLGSAAIICLVILTLGLAYLIHRREENPRAA